MKWNSSWFKNTHKVPRGFWDKKENQREKLETIARELGIKMPKDWGNVTNRTLMSYGAGPILYKYKGSVWKSLISLFPSKLFLHS